MKVYEKLKFVLEKLLRVFNFYTKTKKNVGVLMVEKYAVINLSYFLLHSDMGRYSFLLCQYLSYSGFKVVVKLDRHFFTLPSRYKKLLLDQDYLFVRSTDINVDTIVLFHKTVQKTIQLIYGYRLIEEVNDAYYLPYPPHPFFFLDKKPNSSHLILRSSQKKIKVFFAGNVDQKLYRNNILKKSFDKVISRADMMDHVKWKFRDDAILVTDEKVLYRILNDQQPLNKIVINSARTPQSTWLEILSQSNFFICLPGVSMPWSHNAVEAMAVGTIPIIQYHNLFTPPLVHMKNCIAFNTLEEFDQAISVAFSLDEEQLVQLKNGVIAYYDQFLNPNTVVDKVMDFSDSPSLSLNVAIPYLNVRD